MNAERVLAELRAHVLLALPVSLTFLLRKSVDISSLVFVGRFSSDSDHFLSAAGLASVTANVTGYSMLVGMAGALSTICSQANGAGDKLGLALALQRSLVILPLLVCLPVSVLWVFSHPILEALGQSSALALDAHSYLVALLPGLWAYSLSISLQNFLHSQEYVAAVSAITLVVALLHPVWCYVLMVRADMGFLGAARATSLSRATELLLLALYIHLADILGKIQFKWSRLALQGWGSFLALGVPNLLMMTEWWASEAVIFMAGALPTPESQVAAMSVYQSINSVCFMLPCGLQVAGSTRIGMCLGASDPVGASICSVVAPSLALGVSMCSAALLLAGRSYVGLAFTTDERVLRLLSSTVLVLAVYVLADGTQSALTGVLKGMGKQSAAAPIVLVSYYLLGLPLAAYLAFDGGVHLHALGLCVGTAAGTWTHMFLYVALLARTDWVAETETAQIRILTQRVENHADDEQKWWLLDYEATSVAPVEEPSFWSRWSPLAVFRGSSSASKYAPLATIGD